MEFQYRLIRGDHHMNNYKTGQLMNGDSLSLAMKRKGGGTTKVTKDVKATYKGGIMQRSHNCETVCGRDDCENAWPELYNQILVMAMPGCDNKSKFPGNHFTSTDWLKPKYG